ncbi:PPR37 phosphatase, partial [Jacana jacana]|nr:PPR37 phosphatase [Jacana jacana]
GLAYICEGLKEQRKGLVTLVLWNNQLTHTGMAYLGMTLPHTQSLETLNLGHNPIGNEGVRNLKNGLIGNRSVLRLGLASTKLTCEGAVAVAEFIAESPRLLRLDLRENEIKTGGLMALSLALKVNHSLLRLDLDREPKKESVKSFIETQKALLAEIQNGCKRNFILAKEKEEKEQKLQQSASMPEITVTEPLEEAGETLMASENGATEPVEEDHDDRGDLTDSDSDTDEEADAGLERKDLNEELEPPSSSNGAASAALRPPPSSSSPEKPKDPPPPLCVAEEAPSPALPTGNERRISVSSPGRGHKIFVVTRVETLPDRAMAATTTPSEEAAITPSQEAAITRSQEAATTRSQEAAPTASKPLEPQNPLPIPNPQLPVSRANGTLPESPTAAPGPCENLPHDPPPLPNGLKVDFARALPETASEAEGKTGTYVPEHELSCSKNERELEELLLEASQDAGQE